MFLSPVFFQLEKNVETWLTFHVWFASLQQDQMNLMLSTERFLNLKRANCVGKAFNTEGDFSGAKNEAKPPVNFPINLYELLCSVNYFFT